MNKGSIVINVCPCIHAHLGFCGFDECFVLHCACMWREATGACSKSCHMHCFVTLRVTVLLVLTVMVKVVAAVVVLRGSGRLHIIN